MHLDFNDNPRQQYTSNNVTLESISTEKDLGVLTTDKLSWHLQMKACISKANQMISWITRNMILRDQNVMRDVHRSIVRPHIEYCTQLWSSPAKHGNWAPIIELENVQRRFTRLINDLGTLPYSERLEALKLTSLAERRIRGDLIETFKILNGLVEYGQSLFTFSRSGSKLLCRPSNSADKKIRSLQNSFLSERVINYWNKLPPYVRTSTSVAEFKVNLEDFKTKNIMLKDSGNFWEVSDEVICKMEGKSYVQNKEKQNEFLKRNPYVAKKKGINIYGIL